MRGSPKRRTMSQPGQPTQDRIAATANRLRLLQVELADQPESARRGDLRARLPVPANEPIDPTRLVQLVTLLLDFTLMMERVWNIWRAIAPQSPVKKPAPLQAHFTKFLAGDPEVSRAVVGPDLDRLR